MTKIDPELEAALESFPGFDLSVKSLPFIRQFPAGEPRQTSQYKEVFIETKGKGAPLRCLIIDPIPDADNRPVMLYFHGGGFVFGSPEIALPAAQKLAEDVGCLIVLLNYRLAPEHPYPAALEDGQCALSWLVANAEDLRLDKSRIAIGGDSAGGGHAAVLTAALRENGDVNPACLFLVYPMLDNETGLDGEGGTSVWTAANNRFGWDSYVGEGDTLDKIAKGAVPSKIENLQSFPPTYLATGTLDLFHDENLAFTEKLQNQGVAIEQHIFEGAYHAFDVLVPDAKISQNFRESCVKTLKRHFGLS